MDIQIRNADIKDTEEIFLIERACFPPAEAASEAALKKRLIQFPKSFFVAESEGKIVGFINGAVLNDKKIKDVYYEAAEAHDEKGLYQSVFGLDVLEAYRRKGIAGLLLKTLIAAAAQADRKGVILCCKEKKIPYYESFGFVNIGKSASEHGSAVWYDMYLPFK